MAEVPTIKETNPFDRHLDGVFGRFYTSESYELNYVLTNLSIDDLNYLETAVTALPFESVDFDEMIQRDIDYERIDEQIIKEYLERGKNKVIFFPPILVAPVIIQEGRPAEFYSTFADKIEESKYLATWGDNKFRLELPLSSKKLGYAPIVCKSSNTQHHFINYAATFSYNHKAVKLVVLDGQHRYVALKRIYDDLKKPELIRNIELPVCIFFSPNAVIDRVGGESLLEDMRELFVRINTTAREVSGHFIVLLDDNNLSSISARALASKWKSKDPSTSYLHMLEWNQRESKKADQVNKPYSITTVSIIANTLEKYVFSGKKGGHTRTLLRLSTVEDKLSLAEEAIGIGDICNDTYAFGQKDILRAQIADYVVPALHMLFSKPTPYAQMWEQFQRAVQWLDDRLGIKGYTQFRNDVLFQFRKCQKNDQPSVIDAEKTFEEQIEKKPEHEFYFLNIFQQGLIRSWAALCEKMSTHKVTPERVAQIYVGALELICFDGKKRYFGRERNYLQNVILNGEKINHNETSRESVANLLLATLACNDALNAFCNPDILPPGIDMDDLRSTLRKVASDAISSYLDTFLTATTTNIKKKYQYLGFDQATVNLLEGLQRSTDEEAKKQFNLEVARLAESKLVDAKKVLANILGMKSKELQINYQAIQEV